MQTTLLLQFPFRRRILSLYFLLTGMSSRVHFFVKRLPWLCTFVKKKLCSARFETCVLHMRRAWRRFSIKTMCERRQDALYDYPFHWPHVGSVYGFWRENSAHLGSYEDFSNIGLPLNSVDYLIQLAYYGGMQLRFSMWSINIWTVN